MMTGARLFGTIVHVTAAGGAVVERLDGAGRVYVPSRETALAGSPLRLGDRVEFGLIPGGTGVDAVLA
jgi:hypothetical protein